MKSLLFQILKEAVKGVIKFYYVLPMTTFFCHPPLQCMNSIHWTLQPFLPECFSHPQQSTQPIPTDGMVCVCDARDAEEPPSSSN
eukprot:7003790-Ditylum_brightwellii.AAC.1